MPFLRDVVAVLAVAAAISSNVHAAVVTDQEQPLINAAAGFHGVGGDSEQKLAQSFTVGVNGDFVGLRLPIAGCGRGDLIIEIRELVGSQPTGPVIRSVRVPGSDVQVSYEGFQDFFLPAPIAVSAGGKLAFTVQTIGEGSYCSYATSPDGDTYTRGDGFFDSRPNPPGWVALKGFASGPHDLAFYTLMDDPASSVASSGRCVIPDKIDPVTGLPLELPISRFVPACRCFQDAGLREFRCGILHPDFFVIRRIPFPLIPGQPYEEVWQFSPLADLDGPVRIRLSGAGFEKPVNIAFSGKTKLSMKNLPAVVKSQEGQTVTLKARAPAKPVTTSGIAIIEYDMKDAGNEFQTRFGLDTTIEEGMFGQ